MGNPKSSMESVFRTKCLFQKLMHRPMHLFHTLQCCELATVDQREVGLKLSQSVISFKPYQCDQYLCHWNANINCYTPSIPLHWPFYPLSIKVALGNHSNECTEFSVHPP